jgi:hypothetical protein
MSLALFPGADNVTIAQKHLNMTGLEVRKIAKLPEERLDLLCYLPLLICVIVRFFFSLMNEIR